jgi:hypothetical protein
MTGTEWFAATLGVLLFTAISVLFWKLTSH